MVDSPARPDAVRVPLADLEAHLRVPLGALSPLWFVYAGAATAGAAAWWMTRWMQPVNLEALWGQAQSSALEPPATPSLAPPEPETPELTPEESAAESPTEAAGVVVAAAPAFRQADEAAPAPETTAAKAGDPGVAVTPPSPSTGPKQGPKTKAARARGPGVAGD